MIFVANGGIFILLHQAKKIELEGINIKETGLGTDMMLILNEKGSVYSSTERDKNPQNIFKVELDVKI